MTDQEIIDLLQRTGHLETPFGRHVDHSPSYVGSSLIRPEVRYAIASYQDFMSEPLDRLCLAHHSRPAHADGDVGPATRELFALPRCGCPDYGPDVAAATGSGSWAGCHGIGNYHSALVHVDDDGIPDFLLPHFDDVWDRTIASFAAIGLKFVWTNDKSEANITMSFVDRSRGWIGLAIVGSGQSCDSQIWCRYLATWEPSDIVSMWTELLMHELGHNTGLQHSRGGIMAPSLIYGLPPTWKGDPSEPILKRLYGGVPIPGGPEPPGPPPPVPDDGGYHGILRRKDGAELDCTVSVRGTSPV